MFELSARLIGIYKVANQTRSVAIGMFSFRSSKLVLVTDNLSMLRTDNKELSELQVEDDEEKRPPQSRREIAV